MPSTTDGASAPSIPLPSPTQSLSRVLPFVACALFLIVLTAACGGSEGVIVPPTEEFGGPQHAAVVITSDIAVGRERLAFGVVSREGPPLQADSATVRTYYLPPNTDDREARQILTAKFEPWPFSAGVFAVYPEFDVAGTWELETEFTAADGERVVAKSAFTVKETSDTPSVGDPAPASVSAVASDVPDLSHISTASEPDPGLYAISIDDAVASGKPSVVGFSTPKYCTTGTCGPQLEQLSELRRRYGEQAHFIHVEVYKDPHLFEEGSRPGLDDAAEAVIEWGLPTEPWTFVVDGDGIVRAKFEAFTSAAVIEEALRAVLN